MTLEVTKNADGTYEIVFNGEHVRTRVPERWLNEELCAKLGFCGDEYNSIVQQLDKHGKATLHY